MKNTTSFRLGPDHPNWSGDLASYTAKHRRVRESKGSAKTYECVDCGEQAKDWSQIKDTIGSSSDHYESRCRPCHSKYDGKTKVFLPEQISEIKYRLGHGWSSRELAKEFGVSPTCIQKVKKGGYDGKPPPASAK